MQNVLIRKIEKVLKLENELLEKLDYMDRNWHSFNIEYLEERLKIRKDIDYLKATSKEEIEKFKNILAQLKECEVVGDLRPGIIEANRMAKILKDRISTVKAVIKSIKATLR